MPKSYQNAGKSTRELAYDRRDRLVKNAIFALGIVLIIGFLISNPAMFQIEGIGLLVLIIAARLILNFFDRYSGKQVKAIKRADRGAQSEEDVAILLSELDEDFIVINDVTSSHGNIDHVVISRTGGIFLIETKSHYGRVTTTETDILVNGDEPEKNFIAQTLHNTYWLRNEIESLVQITPWIIPLVVFTHAFVEFGKPVKGVRVINQKFLLKTIQSKNPRSSQNNVIWVNRNQIIQKLTGQDPEPVFIQKAIQRCPYCGKPLIEKIAKGGSQVGKRFMVCPDYPKCKTAIPLHK
jgi:hypothetical protein